MPNILLITSTMKNKKDELKISGQFATPFAQTYFHGTKADLKVGELIEVGFNSNYGQQKNAKYIFLTATLDAAIWGAELAFGNGRERIYLVEPIGEIENDPDLTDKKFPEIQLNLFVQRNHLKLLVKLQFGKDTQPNKLIP